MIKKTIVLTLIAMCGMGTARGICQTNYDSLRIVLEEMYNRDQQIRKQYDSVRRNAPDQKATYMNRMIRIDSLNTADIKMILRKFGWLERSKVGVMASFSIFYVVQHSELRLMEIYLPDLKALAARGEAKMEHVALLEDRVMMDRGKKQIYGTQVTTALRSDGRFAVWPIEDAENVNKRRKEAGLKGTIEEYAQQMGAAYDPREELPKR